MRVAITLFNVASDVTYGKFVCNVRPEKKEQNRTRLVVGGNRINYPGDVSTPTADMLLAKILFNSVISTKGAKFMTADISNFYLMTPLKRSEYVKLNLTDVPGEVIAEYGLKEKGDQGWPRVHQNHQRNVWAPPSRTVSTATTGGAFGQAWLLPEQHCPRAVEARDKAYCFLAGS